MERRLHSIICREHKILRLPGLTAPSFDGVTPAEAKNLFYCDGEGVRVYRPSEETDQPRLFSLRTLYPLEVNHFRFMTTQ